MRTIVRLLLAPFAAVFAIACEAPPPSNALTASGNVEATEVQVAPEVGGRIVELRVDEGDRVKAGDVIATLDTKDIELQIDRARAERAAAVAQLRLLEAGARAEDVRQAEAQVVAATSEIAAIDVEIGNAQTDLDRFEALLSANADLDHAWANVFVPEPVVPRIALGQAATVRTDAGTSLPGKVTYISPRAEFTPRNVQTADERSKLVYRVKVSVDNSAGTLKQGMPVDADFVLR